MSRFFNLRSLVVAAALVSGLFVTGSAQAHGYGYQSSYRATVVNYVPVRVAQTYWVTVYDHCGTPYQVQRTGYRTVQVPVQQHVNYGY